MRAALRHYLDQVDSIERTVDLRDELVQFGSQPPKSSNTPTESLRRLVTQIGQRGLQPSLDGSILLLAAAFEEFISDVMIAYSRDLPTHIVAYINLSPGIRSHNEQQTGRALSRLRSRFTAFELVYFVQNLSDCQAGKLPYVLNGEAMALNDRNLSSGVLKELFNRLGVPDIWDIVGTTGHLVQWYRITSTTTAVSQAKTDLNDFIKTRNQIAHGVGNTIPGPEVVRDYLGFQRMLAASLIESLENRLNSL